MTNDFFVCQCLSRDLMTSMVKIVKNKSTKISLHLLPSCNERNYRIVTAFTLAALPVIANGLDAKKNEKPPLLWQAFTKDSESCI